MSKKKTVIIGISILIIMCIITFFAGNNSMAKRAYDQFKNFNSYLDVINSNEYINYKGGDTPIEDDVEQNFYTNSFLSIKIVSSAMNKNGISINSNEYKELDSEAYYKISEKNIRIPILIYHEITKEMPPRDQFNMQTSAKRFEEQLTELQNQGYSFVSYDDLVEYSKGNKALSEKTLLIGFDDGWIGNYENAFPILKKLNIPAAIYVVDDQVGTGNFFSWQQAEEMVKSGLINIYSHGKTHIYYDQVSPNELLSSLNEAYKSIEEHIGKVNNKVFTYPFGACTEEQIKVLKEAGYIQNMTDDEINFSNTLDLSKLHRYYVKQNESAYTIIKNVNGI